MNDHAEHRQHPRVPFETSVKIQLEGLDDFLEEYSTNICLEGMFIRTKDPLPMGSLFKFRFSLSNDVTVISGKAQVVWCRERAGGPDAPAGMGIRFIEMDDVSRKIIKKVVDLHVQRTGEQPFQL